MTTAPTHTTEVERVPRRPGHAEVWLARCRVCSWIMRFEGKRAAEWASAGHEAMP